MTDGCNTRMTASSSQKRFRKTVQSKAVTRKRQRRRRRPCRLPWMPFTTSNARRICSNVLLERLTLIQALNELKFQRLNRRLFVQNWVTFKIILVLIPWCTETSVTRFRHFREILHIFNQVVKHKSTNIDHYYFLIELADRVILKVCLHYDENAAFSR